MYMYIYTEIILHTIFLETKWEAISLQLKIKPYDLHLIYLENKQYDGCSKESIILILQVFTQYH